MLATATPPPVSAPAHALLTGTRHFGYQFGDIIGRGGMGTVYRAEQVSLQRTVAVKVLGQRFANNRALAEGFLAEARATARLTHYNLVMVHDVHADHARSLYAYAMEYVPGMTLTRLVAERGPLQRKMALHLIYQIAQALSVAHQAGLVHRDVKPDNILVTDQGLAKLVDLGLVRDRLDGQQRANNPGRRRLTLVGTPEWSAPEQSRNPDDAIPASDVFSLGATLFYALTGQAPFTGTTIIDLIVTICSEPVTYPAVVTRDCQQLLELMMAKDTQDRLADGAAVLAALEDLAAGKSLRPMSGSGVHAAYRHMRRLAGAKKR